MIIVKWRYEVILKAIFGVLENSRAETGLLVRVGLGNV